MTRRVIIAGCGFVGTRLALELNSRGDDVWGLSRTAPDLPAGCHHLQADLTQAETLRGKLPSGTTHLVYAASAGRSSDEQYEAVYVRGLLNLLTEADLSSLQRLLFVSSTAVYPQDDGSWVDEQSSTQPTHFSGVRTLQAEQVALNCGLPATVLRCAGIYGPGRTRLIDAVRSGQANYDPSTPRYTNRIHRDDVAGALAHLMSMRDAESIYIGVDEHPADQREVLGFLAQKLGLEFPRPTSDTAKRGGNKRCRGDKLRRSGYKFRFPTYREGYSSMLAT